jgi:hypothetical protein
MRKNVLFYVALVVFLSIGNQSLAQTIIRQSVGALGGSSEFGDTYMAAAVGQSFDVSTSNSKFQFTPGFIQPQRTLLSQTALHLHLNVFPNPANNLVEIEHDFGATNSSLTVTDIYGKVVFEQYYSRERSMMLDCSIWASGTYFITVSCAEYKPQTTKLIINH